MNTTANVKAPHVLRQKTLFAARKTTHINPTKRKMPKTAAVEYLPMVLLPPPQAESVQQYAITLDGSGRVGNSDDSTKEMTQICNKLDQYTKDLENMYGKKKSEVTEESSHEEQQFSSFLSTCDFATRELDTTINEEHQILESLFEGYQKEMQLLEQLSEEDITAHSDIPASHDSVTAIISKLTEILQKLGERKHLCQYPPKTLPQEHFLASPSINAEEKRRGAQIHGPDLQSGWEDHNKDSESVVKALQELVTGADTCSKEVLERIIHDVGRLFDAQAIELHKLGKDHEETENKYIKVNTNYQALLQEKSVLEMELKKLLTWQESQKSSPIVSTGLKERLKKDKERVPSTLTSRDTNQKSEREKVFSCRSQDDEEAEEVTQLSESQDKAELQEEAAPPTDSPVSTLHKKVKLQEEKDTELSEISYTYDHDLDQGDTYMSTSARPSYPDIVESVENRQPDNKTVSPSLNLKEVTEEGDNKVIMKKQKFKSLKGKGRRASKVSSKAKVAGQDGRKSSKTTFTPSRKPEDESFSENKDHQDPEMFTTDSNQGKTGSKLSNIPLLSSGKAKAKINGTDAIGTTGPVVQSHRAKEPASHEQQGIQEGPKSSRSAGQQQGRRQGQQQGRQQGLSSKSRRPSAIKDEKLANGKHKDPTGKWQITKVIPENQPEEQMASKKVDADSFPDLPDNMEGKRDLFTGHSLSKASDPDQEGLFKDLSENGRSTEEYRRLPPSTAAVTTHPPTHPDIQNPDSDDTDTRSRFVSSKKIADKETAQSGNELEPAAMFGEEAPMQTRQSPRTYDVADLINWMNTNYKFGVCPNTDSTTKEQILPLLLGKNVELHTKNLKFQSLIIPSQQHQEVQAEEFPSYDNPFSQSFRTELYVQGRHMSVTHSLPTEISSRILSPIHPRQRAERRTQQLYRTTVSRNIPMEYSILPRGNTCIGRQLNIFARFTKQK